MIYWNKIFMSEQFSKLMVLVKRQVNENEDSAPEIISPNCVLAKRLLKPIFLIEVHDDKLQKNASVNFGSKSIIIVIFSYALFKI